MNDTNEEMRAAVDRLALEVARICEGNVDMAMTVVAITLARLAVIAGSGFTSEVGIANETGECMVNIDVSIDGEEGCDVLH